MHIGLDFDNTIVSYDALFYRVAREQDLVPESTPVNKVAVRDHLRAAGREPEWTWMQGHVYGERMAEAIAFEGVVDFLRRARAAGHELAIVSHKTRTPFRGPAHDLHAAAAAWIEANLVESGEPLVAPDRVHFELTKDAKLARVEVIGCDAFVDDLPEILGAPGFPARAAPILFDPEGHHGNAPFRTFGTWDAIARHLGVA